MSAAGDLRQIIRRSAWRPRAVLRSLWARVRTAWLGYDRPAGRTRLTHPCRWATTASGTKVTNRTAASRCEPEHAGKANQRAWFPAFITRGRDRHARTN
jgi:hypothetical protein